MQYPFFKILSYDIAYLSNQNYKVKDICLDWIIASYMILLTPSVLWKSNYSTFCLYRRVQHNH